MKETSPTRLPEKPAWFTTTFTSWQVPSDIPCARTLPRNTLSIGEACWSFAPGMERTDRYELSTNRGRKHLVLWAGCPDQWGSRWTFVPAAYGPAYGPNGESIDGWHAALHLLVAAWKGEREQSEHFEPPMEISGLLEWHEFEAVCREVWPELSEDGGKV